MNTIHRHIIIVYVWRKSFTYQKVYVTQIKHLLCFSLSRSFFTQFCFVILCILPFKKSPNIAIVELEKTNYFDRHRNICSCFWNNVTNVRRRQVAIHQGKNDKCAFYEENNMFQLLNKRSYFIL